MIKREKRLKGKSQMLKPSSMMIINKLRNLKIRLTTSGMLSIEEMKTKI